MKSPYQELIDGLNILYKTKGDEDNGTALCAEHDVIYAGPSFYDIAPSKEFIEEMEELGWTFDEEDTCRFMYYV